MPYTIYHILCNIYIYVGIFYMYTYMHIYTLYAEYYTLYTIYSVPDKDPYPSVICWALNFRRLQNRSFPSRPWWGCRSHRRPSRLSLGSESRVCVCVQNLSKHIYIYIYNVIQYASIHIYIYMYVYLTYIYIYIHVFMYSSCPTGTCRVV